MQEIKSLSFTITQAKMTRSFTCAIQTIYLYAMTQWVNLQNTLKKFTNPIFCLIYHLKGSASSAM